MLLAEFVILFAVVEPPAVDSVLSEVKLGVCELVEEAVVAVLLVGSKVASSITISVQVNCSCCSQMPSLQSTFWVPLPM